MCLYPKLIKNPRLKNEARIWKLDPRMYFVPIGCGVCYECRKQKAQSWRVRMIEELKHNDKNAYFVTLTFSDEALNSIREKINKNTYDCIENGIATFAMRMFLERWRKKYKKSCKHWFVTELGQTNTERIHMHGIIFCDCEQIKELNNIWKYGRTDIGEYCNIRTINYIVKYVTKIDKTHKDYKSIILCSPGIGASYMETWEGKQIKYRGIDSKEYYTLSNGRKVALPIYYRNKAYTEDERIQLWKNRLDKDTIYVNGIEIQNVSQNYELYTEILQTAQKWNETIGYGTPFEKWKKEEYGKQFELITNAIK